jgi:hypothetical protein
VVLSWAVRLNPVNSRALFSGRPNVELIEIVVFFVFDFDFKLIFRRCKGFFLGFSVFFRFFVSVARPHRCFSLGRLGSGSYQKKMVGPVWNRLDEPDASR